MTPDSWLTHRLSTLSSGISGYVPVTIPAVIVLRIALEAALYHQGYIDGLSILYQFVWFSTAFAYTILVLVYLGRWPYALAWNLTARFSPLILLAPAVDFVLGTYRSAFPTFLTVSHSEFPDIFASFLLMNSNLTPGLLVEIIVMLLLILGFTVLYSGWRRAIIVTILIYSGLWMLGAYPTLLAQLIHCPIHASMHFPIIGSLFTLFSLFLLSAHYPWLTAVLTDLPSLLRFFFYYGLMLAAIGGGALAVHPSAPLQPHFAFPLVLAGFTLYCWLAGARLVNDIFDIAADRINEPHRPLAANLTTPPEVWRVVVLIISIATLNTLFFFTNAATALVGVLFPTPFLLYWLYSVPPFRLKRVLFIGKLLIGGVALVHLLIGWLLTTGSLSGFPPEFLVFSLVGIGLSAHVIDLKDVPGDRNAGIPTLATVLTLRTARLLISAFVLIAYALAFWTAYRLHWYLPIMGGVLILAGIELTLLLTPRWYSDTSVFLLHAMGALGFAASAFVAWFQTYF